MRNRVVALAAVFALSLASAAWAGERGLVANSGGVMKSEPKPKGKKGEKLKQGTMVDVVDHSPDGLWLKVSTNGQEGWVEKQYVRAVSRYGFSWERKDKSGGNQTVGKPASAAATSAAAAATATPDSGWVQGEATPAEGEWENTSNDGWGDTAATPAAGAATPAPTATPAADDGWESSDGSTEVDLTK